MEIRTDLFSLRDKRKPVVMAIGFFDGLHRGHCSVISKALARAEECGGEAWVLTFDRHPLSVVAPERAPSLLISQSYKLNLMSVMGVDGCLVVPFTSKFAALGPRAFLSQITTGIPALSDIFVGRNWRFGRGGHGSTRVLAGICRGAGVRVNVVSPSMKRGVVVSSTAIRAALVHGDAGLAGELMGRPYGFTGVVGHGRTVGRKIGFPTANIQTEIPILLRRGVYAVRAVFDMRGGVIMDGVMNYGFRPTFGAKKDKRPVVEVHFPGAKADLYGLKMEVFVFARIRGERRFQSVGGLKDCIQRDITHAEKILGEIALQGKLLSIYFTPTKRKRKSKK